MPTIILITLRTDRDGKISYVSQHIKLTSKVASQMSYYRMNLNLSNISAISWRNILRTETRVIYARELFSCTLGMDDFGGSFTKEENGKKDEE